jgi:DNA-directed RNA polymerase subunit omega
MDSHSNIVPFDQVHSNSPYSGKPMKSELVEQASEIIKDPQVLINIVSQRVKQLNSGRAALVTVLPSMGVADVALTEIIQGKIKVSHHVLD